MKRVFAIGLILGAFAVGVTHGDDQPRELPILLKALQSPEGQYGALRELEDLGLDAAPAVQVLIRLLDDPDKRIRGAAADVLRVIGKDATAAVPKLVERLDEGELPRISTNLVIAYDEVGLRAAWALGRMGPEAVTPLIGVLTDKRSSVRSNAACALQDIGPEAKAAVPFLIPLLRDRDELVRERAIWALCAINGDSVLTIPALLECQEDSNFNIRVAATSALGAIRPMAPVALEEVIRALRDEDGDVQRAAAKALARLGDEAIPAIPALTEMLKSRKSYRYSHPVVLRPVAEIAARTLGELGPRAKQAVPTLLDLVRDRGGTFEEYGPKWTSDNYRARAAAAIAAARIDPTSDEVLRVLAESLEKDERIRGRAAAALALVGPKASVAASLLMRFADPDSEDPDGLSCVCALVAIDPSNVPAIEQMMEHLSLRHAPTDAHGWALLRTALRLAGHRARPAIPFLIQIAADESEDQRNAALTLAVFGSEAVSAVPVLLDLLGKPWYFARQEAITALGQIASAEHPTLLAGLVSPKIDVRLAVIEVLGQLPGSVVQLTELLDDPSTRIRLAAVQSLANLGDHSEPALPRIRELLRAESPTLREAAAAAIEKIEKEVNTTNKGQ
ncbi:MAG: HEAT repeat domain-containing protein [Pirellulaceae bacterium]|nr:HEAT repeat domain-containing protein [Pirellulaceae bacterium]